MEIVFVFCLIQLFIRYTYCWMSLIVDIWCTTCMRQDLPKRILTAPLFRSRRASTFSTDIILFWLKQSTTCNLGWNVAEFCNLQSPCRHQKNWACLLSLFWTSGLLHHFPWVDYYRSVHPGYFDSANHRTNGVKSPLSKSFELVAFLVVCDSGKTIKWLAKL